MSNSASLLVIGIGLLSFLYRVNNLESMEDELVFSSWISPKVIPSFCFILAGVALQLLQAPFNSRWLRQVLYICITIPLIVSLATLIQQLMESYPSLYQLLFQTVIGAHGSAEIDWMDPNGALSFLLISQSLLLLTRRRICFHWVHALTLTAFLIPLVALYGYLYGLKELYGISSHAPMPLTSAVVLILFCLSILFLHPKQGVMAVVTSQHAGGAMARRLLLALFVLPPLLGGLVRFGAHRHLYTVEMSLPIVVVLNMVVFAVVIWISARSLGTVDRQRQYAEEQINLHAIAAAQAEQLKQVLQDLQTTQMQLIQSEKLSSLGQLVAGLAREINNPVNFVYGNLPYADRYTREIIELVRLYQIHYPNPVSDIQTYAQTIDLEFLLTDLPKVIASMQLGSERIHRIVLSLRNFTGIDEVDIKAIDIHEGIESTLLILQKRLKARDGSSAIHVIKDYGNLPLVECYPGPLNQVLMNLINNAIDALHERSMQQSSELEDQLNGEAFTWVVQPEMCSSLSSMCSSLSSLEFRAKNAVVSRLVTPTICIHTKLLNKQFVSIQVEDNGIGIDETIKSRIFEPFVTTKPSSKGTGLGLAISAEIITRKHNGFLECQSVPGQGTVFTIILPIKHAFESSLRT